MKNKEFQMYGDGFYVLRNHNTHYAAQKIISIVLRTFPAVRSAIDIGCGIGTFLSVIRDQGVTDILGVDGPWVDSELLVIDQDQFMPVNLQSPPKLAKKYDLAVCLEVAEHLPGHCADGFVDWLCEAADIVLFSAAIPGQGGVNHINEAWQSYWARRFNINGFVTYDLIRPEIWDDEDIFYWYRQNTIVFIRDPKFLVSKPPMPLNVVHPDAYMALLRDHERLSRRFSGVTWLLRFIKHFFRLR